MASGIDAARAAGADPILSRLLENMRDQLVIVLIKRLLRGAPGKALRVPVVEIDDTHQDMLMMRLDGRDFVFELRKKQ